MYNGTSDDQNLGPNLKMINNMSARVVRCSPENLKEPTEELGASYYYPHSSRSDIWSIHFLTD